MEFRILGPLEVLDGGRPVEIAGSKRRAVLALLLLHANEVVRSERLVDELWGEQVPRNSSAALHNHVSRLRKALGPELLARREWGYVLRAEPDSIDLHRFEQLVAAAEPLPARERSTTLAKALALWRGPPFADLAAEPALQHEIARLEELRLTTLERRIDADLEAGHNANLVTEVEALIAAQPLREHLRGQLILALYRAGRQAEALEVYRETRRLLIEELGLEPSPALQELERAILRHDPSIAAASPERQASGAEPVPPSMRRGLLLAALGLSGLAAGIGAALAFDHGTTPHQRTQAVATSVSTASTTTAPALTPTRTRAPARRHAPSPAHGQRPRQTPLLARRSKRVLTRVQATVPKKRQITTSRKHVTKTSLKKRKRASAPPPPAPPPSPPSPPLPPKVVTISDDFSGDQIDGTIWYQIYQGTGWTLSQQDGQLAFAFPPGTTPGGQWDNYGGHVGTLCKFPSDFDARVDFTLADWPPANDVTVSLWMWFQPHNVGWEAWRQSSSQWGEQYGGYVGVGHGGSVSLDDTSGTLRVRRRHGVVTTYFLHKGAWVSLGSNENNRTTVIAVGAGSGQDPPSRTNQVVVDFDNFTVTGTDPICPPGAQGSG